MIGGRRGRAVVDPFAPRRRGVTAALAVGLLAAGAVGDVSPAMQVVTGIMGGGMAATSHFTKAGTRALINTSPEPVTTTTPVLPTVSRAI